MTKYLPPSWKGVLRLLLDTYTHSPANRGLALEELERMAEAADRWSELYSELPPPRILAADIVDGPGGIFDRGPQS